MADTTKRKLDASGIAYTAAASKRQFPKPLRQEIVFVGRSNVGKSTLVNALSKRKNLARTSKTPGKTRLVFFYEASPDFYFVDLPGYGYAQASRDKQEAFSRVTDDYFNDDRPIALVLILLDIRRGFGTLDLQMLDYVCHHAIAWQVVLTKADKLSRQAALKAEREVMEVITQYADMYGHPALFPISVAAGLKPGDERMQCLENRIMEFISEQ
ncbi:MAG: ribosome biogenesis GTP-binding protein YsxC [Clostridiaceae bacterium]|jgi:GTP-binding protein|nr:ribosome biogenesis GTP-binding protein YsxC [Clostridiaceae bacterium]